MGTHVGTKLILSTSAVFALTGTLTGALVGCAQHLTQRPKPPTADAAKSPAAPADTPPTAPQSQTPPGGPQLPPPVPSPVASPAQSPAPSPVSSPASSPAPSPSSSPASSLPPLPTSRPKQMEEAAKGPDRASICAIDFPAASVADVKAALLPLIGTWGAGKSAVVIGTAPTDFAFASLVASGDQIQIESKALSVQVGPAKNGFRLFQIAMREPAKVRCVSVAFRLQKAGSTSVLQIMGPVDASASEAFFVSLLGKEQSLAKLRDQILPK